MNKAIIKVEKSRRGKILTIKCPICGKIRTKGLYQYNLRPNFTGMCRKCFLKNLPKGKDNWNWKSGRTKDSRNYWMVGISSIKDEKLRKMVEQTIENRAYGKRRSGRTYEHIVVMIKKLGRPLQKDELTHHIDGNKENNNPDNLYLVDSKTHIQLYWKLVIENEKLKKEVERLKSIIKR